DPRRLAAGSLRAVRPADQRHRPHPPRGRDRGRRSLPPVPVRRLGPAYRAALAQPGRARGVPGHHGPELLPAEPVVPGRHQDRDGRPPLPAAGGHAGGGVRALPAAHPDRRDRGRVREACALAALRQRPAGPGAAARHADRGSVLVSDARLPRLERRPVLRHRRLRLCRQRGHSRAVPSAACRHARAAGALCLTPGHGGAIPMSKQGSDTALPNRPVPFLWRYVRKRPWHFGGLTALIVSAAACAVAVQYGMKLLVDAMAMGREAGNVWLPFGLFIFLIVVENLFWRSAGYLGCRTVVSSCADLRIDLFNHLTGHPMRYFSQHFAGALANRISSAGGAAGGIYGGLAWKIIPPCIDFVGAVIVLFTV